jgi:hypothetical protein
MQASDIFLQIAEWESLFNSRHLYATLYSSVSCISEKKYEIGSDEWHTAWINPHVPSLGMDRERDNHPLVSLFL